MHDEHSHAGSAFSYLGMAFRENMARPGDRQEFALQQFNPLDYERDEVVEIEFNPFTDVRW